MSSIPQDPSGKLDNPPGNIAALQAAQQGSQYGNGGGWNVVAPASAQPDQQAELQWPPGTTGEIAKFIYHSNFLPVREVAIAATLGLLAGVCGRAFTTYPSSDKSLSLYIILVARSGIGKEGMREGIHKMISLANVMGAERFVNDSDFVSAPALHKALLKEPGFLNLQGEIGRKLKRMSSPTDAGAQELRTFLTHVYNKDYLEGKTYSNVENSMVGVPRPALSIIGETTPSTFYEALTPDMMADGFMSRHLVVSYNGDRPSSNEYRIQQLEKNILDRWRSILARALPYQSTLNTPPPIPVQCDTKDIYDKMKRFEETCRHAVNATDDEFKRQAWSRAHLKALQIATLLAIADNDMNPLIRVEHAAWAITIVRRDIEMFESRKESGDIGIDDHSREKKLLSIINKYLDKPVHDSYKIPDKLRLDGIVPRKFLQKRTAPTAAFRMHKLGATFAMDATIKSLIDSGYIMEVDKVKMIDLYGFHGRCFRVLNIPHTL